VLTLIGATYTARSSRAAAAASARATEVAAVVSSEPAQRQADLQAFREIREKQEQDLRETRDEIRSLRALVRAFAFYVSELTGQMRQHGIEPPAPPERVEEYNRTGV
jgi:NAD(P)H-dependent FMN reductase